MVVAVVAVALNRKSDAFARVGGKVIMPPEEDTENHRIWTGRLPL